MAYELARDGYVVSDDTSRLDVNYIHRFLSEESYWAPGIPRDLVADSIANSISLGLYLGEQQVGFTRAVTDRARFAFVADVFVDETHRGKGLGKLLIEAVVTHPQLRNLRRMILATDDAHGLYAQFGFSPLTRPERWMERGSAAFYRNMAS